MRTTTLISTLCIALFTGSLVACATEDEPTPAELVEGRWTVATDRAYDCTSGVDVEVAADLLKGAQYEATPVDDDTFKLRGITAGNSYDCTYKVTTPTPKAWKALETTCAGGAVGFATLAVRDGDTNVLTLDRTIADATSCSHGVVILQRSK